MRSGDRTGSPDRDGDGSDGVRGAVPGDGGRVVRPSVARLDGVVRPAGDGDADPGPVSGGGQRASGSGRADGGAVGAAGGGGGARAFGFDRAVPHDGYAWWYVDGWSDDGRHGIVLIAFVGSVFSPYYARARANGPADPANHAALNVALYGAAPRRWAMTERGRGGLTRAPDALRIGPSRVATDGADLVFEIDEVGMPLPRRVTGIVRVRPEIPAGPRVTLDPDGRHRWQALAPRARIEVDLRRPELRWSGTGYLDTNDGDAPLERDFHSWEWARAATARGASVVYDVRTRAGARTAIATHFDADGFSAFEPPPACVLPPTSIWRIPRPARGRDARIAATLEDTPFYARSQIRTHWEGAPVEAMHESLLLDRFATPIVRAMLPFRMPRRAR